jgi:hypothetical protein
MIGFMLWLLLLVFCWPLALLGALILVPARVLGGNEVDVPQKRRRRLLPDQSVR